ncbi:caspase family protein [Streptomyces griseoflavus]|uniref:OmpA/MotB family protein n=1 Tax=Streptomyces griseoflavus Tu4000 TaxID=467200 RepID=D9XJN6_9ACTN|nr:caspase family protein [Streptomyces griseoflavus]EFL40132.1 OmpA/MotB family protein [Streptomyces griseoflavus Tu4000]
MAKIALLVSNGSYDDPRLHNLPSSIPDATRFAKLLKKPELGGFDTRIVNDASLISVQRSIHDMLSQANADDLVIIYFSGHGLKDLFGRFYLALPETDLSALPATALSGRYIREQINDAAVRKIVIVLDSCFSGAFGRDLIAKSVVISDGTPDEFAEGTGHAILAASSPIQYALEDGSGPAPTSVFTRAICDGISTGAADVDGDGWISLNDLFEYSAKEVNERYPLQTPQMSCFGLDRDLRLLRAPTLPRNCSELGVDVEEALKSDHTELRMAAVTVLGRITHSSNKERASAALRVLRKARGDYHPAVAESIARYIASAPKTPRRTASIRSSNEKRVHGTRWLEVNGAQLARAAQSAATFTNGNFEQLNAVHFDAKPGTLTIWATDRYRVDVWSIPTLAGGEAFSLSIFAPEIYSLKIFNQKERVRMEAGEIFTEFDSEGKMISLGCTEFGNLPDYERLIRSNYATHVRVARASLLDAIERTVNQSSAKNTPIVLDLGSDGRSEIGIRFPIDRKPLKVVSVEHSGNETSIGLSPVFALAALSSFSDKVVDLSVSEPGKPLLLTAEYDPVHRHILMPVRLAEFERAT